MSTTKETQTHEKEEKPKVEPKWQRINMDKSYKRESLERMKDLMEQAVDTLKQMRTQLDKERK